MNDPHIVVYSPSRGVLFDAPKHSGLRRASRASLTTTKPSLIANSRQSLLSRADGVGCPALPYLIERIEMVVSYENLKSNI